MKEVDGAQEIRAAQDGVSMAMLKPGTRQEYYLFTIGNDSVVYYHHLDMSIEGPGGNDGVLLSINTPLDVQSSYLQGMALIEDHTAAETSVLYLRRVGATAVGSNTQELVAIRIRDGQFFPPVVLDSFESRLEASTSHEMAINHYGTQLAVGNDIDQVNDNDYEMRLYTLGWDHMYESGVDNLQVGIVNEAPDTRSFLSVDFSPQSDYLVMTDKLDGTTGGQIYRWNVDNISSQQPQLIQGGIRRRARTIGRKFSGSNVDPSAITTVLLKAEVKSRDYDEYQNPDGGTSITNDISLNLPGNVGVNVQYMLPTTAHQPLRITKVNPDVYARVVGDKQYELTDHLGNVRMVFSDLKKPNVLPTTGGPTELNYATDILTITDYYPFGMQMPGRVYTSGGYRYGFNGMEKDDEVKGSGNSLDFGARMLDPRIGRWFAVDPMASKYPGLGPYTSFGDNPIIYIDPDGEDIIFVGNWTKKQMRAQKAWLKTQWGKAVYRQFQNSETDDIYIGISSSVSNGALTMYNAGTNYKDDFFYPWESPEIEYQGGSYIRASEKKWISVFEGEPINNVDAKMHFILLSETDSNSDEYVAAGLLSHEVIAHIFVPFVMGYKPGQEIEHLIVGGNEVGSGARNAEGSIQEDINNDQILTRINGENPVDQSQEKLESVVDGINDYNEKQNSTKEKRD